MQRKPVEVTHQALAAQFPHQAPQQLSLALGILSGFHPESATPSTILEFGKPPQEELATRVRLRLEAAQSPNARAVPQYLERLQAILQQVLDAFQGGFLRKAPDKVWAEHQAEVRSLEQLLGAADDILATQLAGLADLKQSTTLTTQQLAATATAAEYLVDKLPPNLASLMLTRLASLTASQAMAGEEAIQLDAAMTQTQELLVLVQDGVLLKLPAVHAQLANISGRFNDTQRFQATERLSEILHTLSRRQAP